MVRKARLYAVVWQQYPDRIVEETGAPFDHLFGPFETYGDLNIKGWMVVPLNDDLEAQYKELDDDR